MMAPGKRTPEPPPRVLRGRAAPFLKTPEKPTGDVRPAPRARNQAREPRRRRHAPAPAQDTRGTGTRSPSGKEERDDDRNRTPTGGDAGRRRMTAPLPGTAAPAAQGPGFPARGRGQAEAGATIYPSASSRTARSADPGPQAAWSRPREAAACPRTGRGDRQPDGFMPEPATAYEPCACRT